MLAKLPKHKPIREQYHPVPNAAERRHHDYVMSLGCMVCRIEPCGVAHHLMQRSPYKRWERRDHRQVVNLCDTCHRALHASGNERKWADSHELDLVNQARSLELESIYEGIL